jgi:hypothetical protein
LRTVKIPFPDIRYYEKSRLLGKDSKALTVPAQSTELNVRNTAGMAVDDFLVIDAFESEDGEIVKIADVDAESHLITIEDPTAQDHPVGVVMVKSPYNQVEIYRGLLASMADHVLLTTINLRPDDAYTVYYDSSGTSLSYYSYRYKKNITSPAYDTQTLYADSTYDLVLTVDQLKNWFMFGLDLTDDDGYPFPTSMFEFAIRAAIDALEKTLMIKIRPRSIIGERQDYYRQDYLDFAFIQLNNYPIYDVSKVALRYPTAGSDITFPAEWYQINKQHGQVHLIPTSGSLSQIMMGRGGDYLTFVYKGWDWMPNLWIIDYMAGFPPAGYTYVSTQAAGYQDGETPGTPNDIIGIIGKMSCFYPLNIAGDLVGGIAIASKSIGVDGLSQSINTTSSPENAGYSARLRQYERELKIEVPRLQTFYKGIRMAVM